MNKYFDIERLVEDDPSFDKLHENALSLIARIVERGKELEDGNKYWAERYAKLNERAELLREERGTYRQLYEKTRNENRKLTEENRKLTEENRKLREECHQHKESTLCLADELARHKQENKRLKQSIEALPVIPQTRNATHAQHVEYNVFHPGAMQFKDGQMSGSRFQCSSSSAEQDAYDLKI